MFWTQPAFTCSKWTMNTIEEIVEYFKVVKTLERSQLTPLRYLLAFIRLRISHLRCSTKKAILKNFEIFTRKHLCWSFFLIKLQNFRPVTLSKETPTQVFSCEYYNIFKNTYFEKHLPTAASIDCKKFYRATENQIKMKFE